MDANSVFRALADPTRREILRRLRTREMTAGEIAEGFPLAASTLSGHFKVLRAAGLVSVVRNGTTLTYRLDGAAAEASVGAVIDIFHGGGSSAE